MNAPLDEVNAIADEILELIRIENSKPPPKPRTRKKK
jgi:hypothetical protein